MSAGARPGDGMPDVENHAEDRGAFWQRLSEEHLRNPAAREGVRTYIDLGRRRLLDVHRAGASGTDVVRAHGEMVDCLLRRLFETAVDECRAPTQIRWDNAASDDFTIIEVYTRDRPGVLFTITYLLSKLEFSIHLANISTDVDRVADVFYVAAAAGKKILDEGRLQGLRDALHDELDPEDDRRAYPAG